MKISYKPANKTIREMLEFCSEDEFHEWKTNQEQAEWGEFCQGTGDGSINHLQIEIEE